MATTDGYLLTADDVQDVRTLLAFMKRQTEGSQLRDWKFELFPDTDEIYVAMTPCGDSIPPRVGDTPGMLECCIFKIDPCTAEDSGTELVPLKNPDGTNWYHAVYNIYDVPQGPFVYFEVFKTKFGSFVCEKPEGTSSTTTTSTTTTTGPPTGPSCSGYCVYIWNAATSTWVLDENNCSTTTTSTTTTTQGPTTSSTTSTTTTQCPCPQTSTTSSTTSTTSTTLDPCVCQPPEECGDQDGECVVTDCVPRDRDYPPPVCTSTTSTTTTTCDCNTTTTTTPDPGTTTTCSLGCDFIALPSAGGGWTWRKTKDHCIWICPCPFPSVPASFCAIAHTDCLVTTTTTTVPPACDGGCLFYWTYVDRQWFKIEDTCRRSVPGCHCQFPSQPGPDDDCVYDVTPCAVPTTTTLSPTTTSTRPPCEHCYTTTTSTNFPTTTTTVDPCSAKCKWSWSPGGGAPPFLGGKFFPSNWLRESSSTGGGGSGSWVNESNPCPGHCPCSEPPYPGRLECEVAWTNCGTGTTGNPVGACCDLDLPGLCRIVTQQECGDSGIYLGDGTSCSPNPCGTTTTTTGDPVGACCYGIEGGTCNHLTKAQCDQVFGAWQGGGTVCSPTLCPPTTTTSTTTTTTTTSNPCAAEACTLTCIQGRWIENPQDQCGQGCQCRIPGGGQGPFGNACTDEGSTYISTCQRL